MAFEECAFQTERIAVAEWRIDPPADLPARVATVLTEATTQFLPPEWQGDYSEDRARSWIADRGSDGETLLVTDAATGVTVGLVILFAEARPSTPALVDVRLGYVLAEAYWGRGLASELVAGLVTWCRAESTIGSLAGGVEVSNRASARVLTKNGFVLVEPADGGPPGEELYRLDLS